MSASVQTPAGLKTVSAVSIQTAAGLKTASAGYVGTAAGAKQFFSSGGGGGGGTTPPPVTPPYSVAISQSGSGLGSIAAGQNASATLSAVVSQGSAALAPPFSYAWSATSSNPSVASVSLSSKTVQSPTISETGNGAGTATITATVVVTDANGVQETATLSYTVTVSAAAPLTVVPGGTENITVDVGETAGGAYGVAAYNGRSPYTYAWSVQQAPNASLAIGSGQGTSRITVSFTGTAVGQSTVGVTCLVTDASRATYSATVLVVVNTPS
jgi:hypothetical protein